MWLHREESDASLLLALTSVLVPTLGGREDTTVLALPRQLTFYSFKMCNRFNRYNNRNQSEYYCWINFTIVAGMIRFVFCANCLLDQVVLLLQNTWNIRKLLYFLRIQQSFNIKIHQPNYYFSSIWHVLILMNSPNLIVIKIVVKRSF